MVTGRTGWFISGLEPVDDDLLSRKHAPGEPSNLSIILLLLDGESFIMKFPHGRQRSHRCLILLFVFQGRKDSAVWVNTQKSPWGRMSSFWRRQQSKGERDTSIWYQALVSDIVAPSTGTHRLSCKACSQIIPKDKHIKLTSSSAGRMQHTNDDHRPR